MEKKSNKTNCRSRISRRQFLGTAASVSTFTIVPRHVLGGPARTAPSDKLNIACIGVGGKGFDDVRNVMSENIVAICDVDTKHAAEAFKMFSEAKKYSDYRRMLDKEEKNIDADGKNRTQLTNDEHRNWYQSYSPDGKKIVYSSNRNGVEDIWIMDADGSNKKKLTNNDNSMAHGPTFSPDGKTIVFMSNIHGKHGDNMQVWTIGADGKNLKCLTDRDVPHLGVEFSPCGKYIAYKSPWDGYWNIYIMDADGGNIRQLTHSKSEDLNT